MEGGPYQEYFYIEIPVTAGSSSNSDNSNGAAGEVEGSDNNNKVEKGKHRRFVYVQEESATKFPMQFGLEVSHWLFVTSYFYYAYVVCFLFSLHHCRPRVNLLLMILFFALMLALKTGGCGDFGPARARALEALLVARGRRGHFV